MTKSRNSNLDILQFYQDDDLNEILSDNSIDRFIESKKAKEKAKEKANIEKANINIKNQNNIIRQDKELSYKNNDSKKDSFIKPVFSTSEAVYGLAKRFNQNNSEEKMLNDSSFKTLKEIIKQAQDLANRAKTPLELKKIVEDFEGCNLKKMATNTVFCDGNANAKIMVIGEAPGNHEDLQGIPFCGDSGKLLDAMFQAINLTRENDYYISNVIFWRPPGNRKPTEEELAICKPFVDRHIQLIAPKVIVLVGATAMNAILNKFDPISKIRGQFLDLDADFLDNKIKIFTIFHPSYLMRQPAKKKIAWQDMLALEKFIQENNG